MSNKESYQSAAHAMQSGVAAMMEIDPTAVTRKHLRVGINCAMSDHGALVSLLLEKGVFTLAEYEAKLVEFMIKEKETYEAMLTEKTGTKITLG